MQLITDRTEADVLLGNAKGRYGTGDLNRVEAQVGAVLSQFAKMDIHPGLQVKTDWLLTDLFSPESWPVRSQMQRYLENVRILCRALNMEMPLPESMERLTWEGANQIEQALSAAGSRAEGVIGTYQFSGEVFAGEELYI